MKQHARVVNMITAALTISAVFFCRIAFAEAQAHELSDGIQQAAGEALKYIWVIGTIVAVLVLGFYGIAWITASPQQKAVLKEKASIYIIGAVLLYGGASITIWIVNILLNAFGSDLVPVPDR